MVKKFYRPVISEDFDYVIHDLPATVITLIHQGVVEGKVTYIREAQSLLYRKYGQSMQSARRQVRAYQCYLLAKRDFEAGNSVFIEYSDGL